MTFFLSPEISPAFIMIMGGLLAAFLPQAGRNLVGLVTILLSLMHLYAYDVPGRGEAALLLGQVDLFSFPLSSGSLNLELTMVRIDKLGFIFALIFHIAAFLNLIFGWRHANRIEGSLGVIYAGSAIGGVLAGDLLTLFIFWELAALSSVFIVWAGGGHAAYKAGVRYLVIQVISGMFLLAGMVLHVMDGNDLMFTTLIPEGGVGKLAELTFAAKLMLVAFGIKACFPFVHTWMQDSYPRATAVGTVILSAFTTKMAVYTLARGFPGLDILVPIGCIMTVFPVFFALIENDLRKVLAYSVNNQVGFMVAGVGIGTALSLNGAATHAVADIIFKGLLFMSMGAVLVRVGTTKATELGGLHKSMPLTTVFCIIGAMSISAFPFFSGFVTKSMITLGASESHMLIAYMVLLFSSAGALEHSGVKIPYFAFFAHDNHAPSNTGKPRPGEAPFPMLLAMGIAAALCIYIGVKPDYLLSLAPYEAEYHAYTGEHVAKQMQLLLFAILCFGLLIRFKLYPPEIPSVNLDADWLWRVPGRIMLMSTVRVVISIWRGVWGATKALVGGTVAGLYNAHGPEGRIARTWPVGYTALTTAIVLGIALIFVFSVR